MQNIDAFVGEAIGIQLEITLDGAGVTGESPTITIKRMSDDNYYTGAAWQVGATTIAMAEYDATNFPGMYSYSFTLLATTDVYRIRLANTGAYALDEYRMLTGRKKPVDETAATRTSTSPASATYGEKLEEIHSAVIGRMQLDNSGTGSRCKISLYNYAEANVIKEMDVLKTNGTVNTQTLDANALAGRLTST